MLKVLFVTALDKSLGDASSGLSGVGCFASDSGSHRQEESLLLKVILVFWQLVLPWLVALQMRHTCLYVQEGSLQPANELKRPQLSSLDFFGLGRLLAVLVFVLLLVWLECGRLLLI